MVTWTDKGRKYFQVSKDALARETLLTYPQVNAQPAMMTDTSDVDVGAVLQQQIGCQWHPILYFSKKLKPAEARYSAFNCEVLAIYPSIQPFDIWWRSKSFVFSLTTNH